MDRSTSEAAAGEVECYSGHAYAVEPRAVAWQGVRHTVDRVIARWRTSDGPAFRVQVDTGAVLDLAYDEAHDTWVVIPQSVEAVATPTIFFDKDEEV